MEGEYGGAERVGTSPSGATALSGPFRDIRKVFWAGPASPAAPTACLPLGTSGLFLIYLLLFVLLLPQV